MKAYEKNIRFRYRSLSAVQLGFNSGRRRGGRGRSYEKKINIANDTIGDTDKDDVPFLAVALEKDAMIRSDDRHFEDQDEVKVWNNVLL